MREAVKKVLDSLNGGEIACVETEVGRFIGIFERQTDRYMLFTDTEGNYVTVDKPCLTRVKVTRVDELDKMLCVSNSFFYDILISGLEEKYGKRWVDYVNTYSHPNLIMFSSDRIKFRLKNGECKIGGGINLEIGRMGELNILNGDVVMRVGDLEAIMDRLVLEVPESIQAELEYEEAMEKIAMLEYQVESYKNALKCSLNAA